MWTLLRKRWAWIAAGTLALTAAAAGLSMSTNKQVAYAPCLAKVVTALRADPAAQRYLKLASEPVIAEADGCAAAEDTARAANRAITDLLVQDKSLFERLPALLAGAGMECEANDKAVTCDCKSQGPFAIANPCATCGTLVDVPVPLKRAFFVAVEKHPSERKGKLMTAGTYVVAVAYSTAIFETGKPEPLTQTTAAIPTMGELVQEQYGW